MRQERSPRAAQAALQKLESLQRAGVRQLPKPRGRRVPAKSAGASASEQPAGASIAANLVPAITSATPAAEPATPAPLLSLSERRAALGQLCGEVEGCQKCPALVANRSRTVFGVGPPQPRLAFFGEAPGADEDRAGEPFVGRAGQLLNKIIEACGLKREDVYILNVLKCRPPENRAPLPDEVANCRPFFERQLEILRPEFVCCLGLSATQALLESTLSLGMLRKKIHAVRGMQVVATYHPAYLLRNPPAKKDTWEDMQMLLAAMGLPVPSKV